MTAHESCGTRYGIAAHATNGEPPCGTCLTADDARTIAHEARQPVPVAPSGPMVDLGRVIAVLAQALEDHDRAARRRMRDVQREEAA